MAPEHDRKPDVDAETPQPLKREVSKSISDDSSDGGSDGTYSRPKAESSEEELDFEESAAELASNQEARKAVAKAIRKARKHTTNIPWKDDSNINRFKIVDHLSEELMKKSKGTGKYGVRLREHIIVEEMVLRFMPEDYPARRERLNILSDMLAQQSGEGYRSVACLDRAIQLAEMAMEITPGGHPEMCSGLRNMSRLFEYRFRHSRKTEDMEKAIGSIEKVAEICKDDQKALSMAQNEILCLRLKGGETTAIPCVLEVPCDSLGTAPLSLDGVSPCRFRFLDCQSLVHRNVIRIFEMAELPVQRYTAVSYVWHGLGPIDDAEPPRISITVRGAEDADPIAFDVLRTACLASLHLKSELMWLDRLCIIQGNREDKNWQIKNMYDVYKSCKVCLVLPGGLLRLATLTEETTWIHRAWTLQEALAPPSVRILFSWTLGKASLQDNGFALITEIEPQKAAIAPLLQLLERSLKSPKIIPKPISHPESITVNIMGHKKREYSHIISLLCAIRGKRVYIWRSAYMRTSSRPIDMVFSIMGLLGVTLDPSMFKRDDRHGATIALMQALLEKGEPAIWLGMLPRVPISQSMSTLPAMPKTSVEGKAYVQTLEGYKEIGSIANVGIGFVGSPPKGSMDDKGYFAFGGKTMSIRRIEAPLQRPASGNNPDRIITSSTGNTWQALLVPDGPPYAVVIGTTEYCALGIFGMFRTNQKISLMLVDEHATDRLHTTGYAKVEESVIADWVTRQLTVGGPLLALEK